LDTSRPMMGERRSYFEPSARQSPRDPLPRDKADNPTESAKQGH
jgi:hypothetical protein